MRIFRIGVTAFIVIHHFMYKSGQKGLRDNEIGW